MAIDKPSLQPFEWLWDAVCVIGAGSAWPDGDEDVLRDLSAAWRDLGNQVNKGLSQTDSAAVQIMTAWGGDAGNAFSVYWNAIAVGPDNGLPQIADAAMGMGDYVDDAAMQIEYAKLVLVITLVVTVITLVICSVLAFFTAGAAEAAAAAEVAAARTVASQLFRQLMQYISRSMLRKVLLRFVVHEVQQVGLSVGTDWLAQEIQISEGHRKDLDVDALKFSAVSGAISGLLTFPGSFIPVPFKGALGQAAFHGVTQGLVNGVAMPASTILTRFAMTQNWDWKELSKGITWNTLLYGAINGAGMGSIGSLAKPHGDHP